VGSRKIGNFNFHVHKGLSFSVEVGLKQKWVIAIPCALKGLRFRV
jgi:hypothetical protein